MLDRDKILEADRLDREARKLQTQAALIRHEAHTPAMTYEQVMLIMIGEGSK